MRWRDDTLEFNFMIQHISGVKNQIGAFSHLNNINTNTIRRFTIVVILSSLDSTGEN